MIIGALIPMYSGSLTYMYKIEVHCIIILIEAVYDKCLISSRVAEHVVVINGEPDFMTKDLPKNYD